APFRAYLGRMAYEGPAGTVAGARHHGPHFIYSPERRGVVILSERAARARAKDLLAVGCGTKGAGGMRASEGPACGRRGTRVCAARAGIVGAQHAVPLRAAGRLRGEDT